MVKSLVLIFTFLLLSGCGTRPDPRTFKTADPAFQEQVKLFEDLFGQSVYYVGIGFMNQDAPQVGLCKVWSTGHKEIFIDPVYWQGADENERINLIVHELGHCALGRKHKEDTFYYDGDKVKSQVPVSLMFPYNFFYNGLEELKSYYFHELFNPKDPSEIGDFPVLEKSEGNETFYEFIN